MQTVLLNGTEVSLDLVLLAATPLRGAHRRISIITSRCLSPSFLGCDGTLHRARDGRAACRPRPRMGFERLLQVGDRSAAAGANTARGRSLIPSFNFGAQRWRKRSAAGALAPGVALESLHVGKGLRTGRAARHSSDSYCRLLSFDLPPAWREEWPCGIQASPFAWALRASSRLATARPQPGQAQRAAGACSHDSISAHRGGGSAARRLLDPSVALESLHVGKGLRTRRAARHSSKGSWCLFRFNRFLNGAKNSRAASRLLPQRL